MQLSPAQKPPKGMSSVAKDLAVYAKSFLHYPPLVRLVTRSVRYIGNILIPVTARIPGVSVRCALDETQPGRRDVLYECCLEQREMTTNQRQKDTNDYRSIVSVLCTVINA